ncbi:MAG: HNH endonuclease [Candidatus Nanopelagicales bacterium]|jgi:hypothetical protein|nr:HNH endonuclease [Candidatus Nanopelagicales bacterium]
MSALEMGVLVIDVCVAVRGDDGVLVDPAEVGLEALVGMIRAIPPGAPPGEHAVFGASVDVLEAVEAVVGQATALRAAAVHAVAEDTPAGVVADQVIDVLMMALGRSRRSGSMLREQSLLLTHQPEVWAALWTGQLDVAKAGILARALYLVPRADVDGQRRPEHEADCARILASGLAHAAEHTARQLDRYLRRLLAQIDPTSVATRRRRALAERGVWIAHQGDGTADLTARLDSADAERVYSAIRALGLSTQRADEARADRDSGSRADHPEAADPCPGGPGTSGPPIAAARPFDLYLADALVDLIVAPGVTSPAAGGRPPEGAATHSEVGVPSGAVAGAGAVAVSTQINITIPIDSLAGLSDTPGQLSGFGIIPADLVRRLAGGDARWRHVLTDRATGALLDVGTWSYRPPAALARHVRTRDVTCRFPGCSVPARDCDLDHLVPFPVGPTSADNLHALCRRHHRLKHDDNWHVQALPDHGLRWTGPLGTTRDTWPDVDHAHERLTHAA